MSIAALIAAMGDATPRFVGLSKFNGGFFPSSLTPDIASLGFLPGDIVIAVTMGNATLTAGAWNSLTVANLKVGTSSAASCHFYWRKITGTSDNPTFSAGTNGAELQMIFGYRLLKKKSVAKKVETVDATGNTVTATGYTKAPGTTFTIAVLFDGDDNLTYGAPAGFTFRGKHNLPGNPGPNYYSATIFDNLAYVSGSSVVVTGTSTGGNGTVWSNLSLFELT